MRLQQQRLSLSPRTSDWAIWRSDTSGSPPSAEEHSTRSDLPHPSLERVAEVLDNGPPANVADLWALTIDFLRQLSREIRDGATSDWRQYWNVDQYNKAQRPKPENACRDALLSDLRTALAPLSIDAVAEGTYADDKRSDIRLSVTPHNVPIEIKKELPS